VDNRRELYKSALTVTGKKKFHDFCYKLQLQRHFKEEKPFVGKPGSYFLKLILKFDKCLSCFLGCCRDNEACGNGSRKGQALLNSLTEAEANLEFMFLIPHQLACLIFTLFLKSICSL
jgi:hypothetical protein